jgi:Ala-tRNA(Pro) deacylase
MAIGKRLEKLLAEEHVAYRVVGHRPEFGAQRVAASAHVPGRDVAKVVILRDAGDEFLMVVIPSQTRLDLAAVSLATGRPALRLAHEKEFAGLFPDCEPGAMPPFGGLYGIRTYVDGCLREEPEVFFPGGSHHELVRMKTKDFLAVAQPVIGQWCLHQHPRAA